ncbi:MAG TPA: hypothetical protein PLH83_11690 [Ruminococcus sp.]|nr:hypothetical protein [Ruminococcus sp.]
MICIAKRGTEFEKSLKEHGAKLLDNSNPVWVTYSERSNIHIYEKEGVKNGKNVEAMSVLLRQSCDSSSAGAGS